MSTSLGTSAGVPTVVIDVNEAPPTEPADYQPAVWRPSPAARLLILPIRGYQLIRPYFPPTCRFAPSCSEYAVIALRTHGAVRGVWLTVRRLLRCAPWHPGGWDPVPPRRGRRAGSEQTFAEEND